MCRVISIETASPLLFISGIHLARSALAFSRGRQSMVTSRSTQSVRLLSEHRVLSLLSTTFELEGREGLDKEWRGEDQSPVEPRPSAQLEHLLESE